MAKWTEPDWMNSMAIRVDFSHMMSDFIGPTRGITRTEIDDLSNRAAIVSANIEAGREDGILYFYRLPHDMESAKEVTEIASLFQGKCDDLVILGIGGSALGTSALFRALCHPHHNLISKKDRNGFPRVFVLDNVDPSTIKSILNLVNPEKTVFNVITKSGTTTETVSQFLIIRQMLIEKMGEKVVKEHLVVTTGVEEGKLRIIAERAGYPLLPVPENVGGRFSVLSPVGLFPASMLGIDIQELLAGARFMDERCRTNHLWENPAFLSGTLHYLADVKKGLKIAVMMPYSDALLQIAYWFRQLWAESLGKAETTSGETVNVGQTPVVALGVTDQHSQLQLYSEGPFDKLITFLLVKNTSEEVVIPPHSDQDEGFSYLGGHTLSELMHIEAQSTMIALAKSGRSNMSIILPEINPFTIGQLLFLLEVQTVFTGGLYDINPLNQPGVEASKQFIYGMMDRPGFKDKAQEAREWQSRQGRYIIR